MKSMIAVPALFAFALLASACAHPLLPEPPEYQAHSKPPEGKALLMVLRQPKRRGTFGRQPRVSLYHLSPDHSTQEFLGILSEGERLSYVVDPGAHMFMIVGGENADFLEAHMDADKTYYTGVVFRMGMIRQRYSLLPFSRTDPQAQLQFGSEYFRKLLGLCNWVEADERDQQWYASNRHSVDKKREFYMRKWIAREEEGADHWTLDRKDGVTCPPCTG